MRTGSTTYFGFVSFLCLASMLVGCGSEPAEPEIHKHNSSSPISESDTPASDSESTPEEKPASDKKTRVTLTATEFQEALQEDRSGKPFYDKEVELIGTVENVGLLNGPFVIIEMIRFDTIEKEPWSKVLPGQAATLLATVSFEEGVMVTIESTEGKRTVIPADGLATKIITDDMTKITPGPTWMEVTGEVLEVNKSELGNPQVILKGDEDVNVTCGFAQMSQDQALAALKAGDQVRLVGSLSDDASSDMPELRQCLLITE